VDFLIPQVWTADDALGHPLGEGPEDELRLPRFVPVASGSSRPQ